MLTPAGTLDTCFTTNETFIAKLPATWAFSDVVDLLIVTTSPMSALTSSVNVAVLLSFQARLPDTRNTMFDWAEKKGAEGLAEYIQEKNMVSLDGLPTGQPR